MKSFGNILWGVILVILGIIFGLNALEITNIDIFFKGWWTLFIIVPNTIEYFNGKDKTLNLIGVLIGVALLLACWDIITFELIAKLTIPMILIIVGLSIIFKDSMKKNINKELKSSLKDIDNSEEYYAIFCTNYIELDEKKINGTNINAIFGTLKCDLSQVKITDDLVLKTTSVFGNILLRVPDDVNVVTSITPIFGKINRKKKTKDTKHTIYLIGTVMFGGIDVK